MWVWVCVWGGGGEGAPRGSLLNNRWTWCVGVHVGDTGCVCVCWCWWRACVGVFHLLVTEDVP